MFRLFLCAVLLTGLNTTTDAQVVRGYGVQIGIASTNVTYKDEVGNGEVPQRLDPPSFYRRYGFGVAGFVEWLNGPNVSFLTTARFIQKGYAIEYEGRDSQNNPAGTHRTATQINYLSASVPLKIRFRAGTGAPFVSVGPRIDMVVGGDPTGPNSAADTYKSMVVGWDASVGYEIERTDRIDLITELVYSRDETNSLPDNSQNWRVYHNALSFMVGLRWN